jgi:hypothetical protein
MAAKLHFGTSSKRVQLDRVDDDVCIFCPGKFTDENPAVTNTLTLDKLFEACRKRQDEIGKMILGMEDDLNAKSVVLTYHRNCRASYQSPLHVSRTLAKQNLQKDASSEDGVQSISGGASRFTRSHTSVQSTFDWKANCFICGEKCSNKHRSLWSLVESTIDSDSPNMYMKMMQAAHDRQDHEMLARLCGVTNGDLMAADARYHRRKGCLGFYINPRNIAAAKQEQEHSHVHAHKKAIMYLKEQWYDQIVEEKQVFLLTTLTQAYRELLHNEGVPNSYLYRANSLKTQLT